MSTTSVEIQDAQSRLADLVQQAGSGTEVVLTEGGVPVARLSGIAKPNGSPRIPGLHAGEPYWMSEDFDDPLPDEFWLGDDH